MKTEVIVAGGVSIPDPHGNEEIAKTAVYDIQQMQRAVQERLTRTREKLSENPNSEEARKAVKEAHAETVKLIKEVREAGKKLAKAVAERTEIQRILVQVNGTAKMLDTDNEAMWGVLTAIEDAERPSEAVFTYCFEIDATESQRIKIEAFMRKLGVRYDGSLK